MFYIYEYEHSMYISRIHVWVCNITIIPHFLYDSQLFEKKLYLQFYEDEFTMFYNSK